MRATLIAILLVYALTVAQFLINEMLDNSGAISESISQLDDLIRAFESKPITEIELLGSGKDQENFSAKDACADTELSLVGICTKRSSLSYQEMRRRFNDTTKECPSGSFRCQGESIKLCGNSASDCPLTVSLPSEETASSLKSQQSQETKTNFGPQN